MPYASLSEFIDALRKAGELHLVGASVDPRLEISEVTDRVVKAGGPALLFSNVKGSSFPVLTNQFGTHCRMALALDAKPRRCRGACPQAARYCAAGGIAGREASRRVAARSARACHSEDR